jgi:hypothetical protein
MSTQKDRLDVIQGNYNDAVINEPSDLAQAATATQVAAVQQNVANARHTYFAAAVAALTNSGAAVEAAYTAAQTALNAVKQARANSEQITTLLQKLGSSTAAATSLLNAAKSA